MNADIIGLIEIENDGYGSGSAIQDLVNGLNASAPVGTTYTFINPGVSQVGTDEITVGFVYRVETVTPVGPAAIKTNGAFSSLNRPPMAQTFQKISGGGRLTVAVNHFKSKGSACAGDPDTGDGQGNCNQTRVNAANDLTSWLAGDPTNSGDSDFLIIGDLNAYAKEDPITAIKNAGYTNLTETFLGQFAYSYVFEGQSGYLDHALATSGLVLQVNGIAEWHINCDEPVALDYNGEFKNANLQTTLYAPDQFRVSDHDPVVIGLLFFRWRETGRRKLWLWLIPPAHTIWTNLHGGYIQGLAILATLALGETFTWARASRMGIRGEKAATTGELKLLWGLVPACIAASLINPYGYRILLFPFQLTSLKLFMGSVYEWLPPYHVGYNSTPMFFFYIIQIGALGTAFFLSQRDRPPSRAGGDVLRLANHAIVAALAVACLFSAWLCIQSPPPDWKSRKLRNCSMIPIFREVILL